MSAHAHRTGRFHRFWSSRLRDVCALLLVVAVLVGLRILTRDSPEPEAGPAPAPETSQPATPPQAVASSGPPLTRTEYDCVTPKTAANVTVVTYNIKSARYGGYSRLPAIADELADMDADVVLLQEVDRNRYTSGRVAQPDELGSALGFDFAFGLNVLRPGDSEYGTAILSRYPITGSVNTPLPNRAGMQQRGLLHVTVTIKGMDVSFYTTHLQHTSRSMRVEQMARVVDLVADDPLPVVLGGDLNDTPASPVLGEAEAGLDDTWTAVGSGQGATAPAGSPRARIDYLLYRQGEDQQVSLEAQSAEVMGGGSSDHRAVRATYRLVQTLPEVCVPLDDAPVD